MKNILLMFGVFIMTIHSVLSADKILEFQQLPKAELHLHLGGSFPKEFLFSIATEAQKEQMNHSLDLISQRMDYHEAFHIFGIISQIVNSEEKLQNGVEELCVSLQNDNVHYVEIRTGLKNLGQGLEEYLKAILNGIKAKEIDQFKARIVLSVQRNSSVDMAKQTVDLAIKYRHLGVVGIDISGNSTIGNIDQIMPELMRARDVGIPFIVHMGEMPGEDDQMQILTKLEPKRIGHGVYLCDEAKDWILSHKTPLEICLTSSVLAKMIDEYKDHPGLDFLRSGHPVMFCTDDPLVFSITLSQELLIAHELCGISFDEIKQIVRNSFDYTLDNSNRIIKHDKRICGVLNLI